VKRETETSGAECRVSVAISNFTLLRITCAKGNGLPWPAASEKDDGEVKNEMENGAGGNGTGGNGAALDFLAF
jgi:hypothetical protein